MVVQVPLILGLREMTAGKVTGPAGSSGVLGSQAFRLDFKCALGNSLNLCDICFVPHMFKSVSPESTAELLCVCVCVCECAHTHSQSCPTVCDPMDWSLPGFFVLGISQAEILEWVTISSSRGYS